MEQVQNDFLSQPEFLSFERRLMEVVHELNMKRRLLDEGRANLEGALRRQHELECMLDVERRDSQAMRMQLKVAVEAVQKYGEERAATSPEFSRLRIELEAAVRERDYLKDQIHTSQLENLTLNRQVEELQGQLRCQQMFQENTISLEAKIRTAVEEVKSEMQKLDQDHKRLERTCEVAEKMGVSLQEAHDHFLSKLKRTAEQEKKHESEAVTLRAEVERLKMEKSAAPVNVCKDRDNYSETSRYLQEIKEFVVAESKGSSQLHEALQKGIQAQAAFHKLEQNLREKLQKEMEQVSELQSSNSALNNSLSEACATVRSLEQQVQELLAKHASEDQSVQTDTLKFVFEEQGTQTDADMISADEHGSIIMKKESLLPESDAQKCRNNEQAREI